MTIRIERYIICSDDLNHFLWITAKFSKRFYDWTIRYDIDDTEWLKIEAIGISRDLVYKVVWEMEIYPYEGIPANLPKDLPKGYEYGSMQDTIPRREEACDMLYPHKEYGNYADVFRYNSFIEVDKISEQ